MNISYQVLSVFLALLACLGLLLVYAAIGGYLGWRSGGGAIPMLILFAALIGASRAIWRWGIMKRDKAQKKAASE